MPALEALDPRIVLVSAGFDAHANDPLDRPSSRRARRDDDRASARAFALAL
jgi:acetoin utilization deacetylase AcuC-like enzyme